MPDAIAWARLFAVAKPFCRPMPRAGAWYPVVRDIGDRLVLKVGDRRVAVACRFLEVRDRRPLRFTVVRRPAADPNPAADTPEDLGRVYAVCPSCVGRIRLFGEPQVLTCRRCGHRGEVAWWETG